METVRKYIETRFESCSSNILSIDFNVKVLDKRERNLVSKGVYLANYFKFHEIWCDVWKCRNAVICLMADGKSSYVEDLLRSLPVSYTLEILKFLDSILVDEDEFNIIERLSCHPEDRNPLRVTQTQYFKPKAVYKFLNRIIENKTNELEADQIPCPNLFNGMVQSYLRHLIHTYFDGKGGMKQINLLNLSEKGFAEMPTSLNDVIPVVKNAISLIDRYRVVFQKCHENCRK